MKKAKMMSEKRMSEKRIMCNCFDCEKRREMAGACSVTESSFFLNRWYNKSSVVTDSLSKTLEEECGKNPRFVVSKSRCRKGKSDIIEIVGFFEAGGTLEGKRSNFAWGIPVTKENGIVATLDGRVISDAFMFPSVYAENKVEVVVLFRQSKSDTYRVEKYDRVYKSMRVGEEDFGAYFFSSFDELDAYGEDVVKTRVWTGDGEVDFWTVFNLARGHHEPAKAAWVFSHVKRELHDSLLGEMLLRYGNIFTDQVKKLIEEEK